MQEENWLNDHTFTVHGVLSSKECLQQIAICEDVGFEAATVTTPGGAVQAKNLRNNDRVMFASHEIANQLWEQVVDFVPAEMEGRRAVGLNELLRYYRYDSGQFFDWHQDYPYERDNGEKSFLTLLIYLNGDFQGGGTAFEDSCSEESFDEFEVQPKAGLALFFEHSVRHKGMPILEGRKYVLRTDVMYSVDQDEFEEDEGNWDDE